MAEIASKVPLSGYLRGFPGSSERDKHLIYVPINSLTGHIFHFMEELNIGWKAKQICESENNDHTSNNIFYRILYELKGTSTESLLVCGI